MPFSLPTDTIDCSFYVSFVSTFKFCCVLLVSSSLPLNILALVVFFKFLTAVIPRLGLPASRVFADVHVSSRLSSDFNYCVRRVYSIISDDFEVYRVFDFYAFLQHVDVVLLLVYHPRRLLQLQFVGVYRLLKVRLSDVHTRLLTSYSPRVIVTTARLANVHQVGRH